MPRRRFGLGVGLADTKQSHLRHQLFGEPCLDLLLLPTKSNQRLFLTVDFVREGALDCGAALGLIPGEDKWETILESKLDSRVLSALPRRLCPVTGKGAPPAAQMAR